MIYKIIRKFKNIINHYDVYCYIDSTNFIGKFCKIDGSSKIGKHNYINRYTYITKAEIGNYNSIGLDVLIGPGEHDYQELSMNSKFNFEKEGYSTSKKCIIGNDVWIGSKSIILRGVTLGNGCVVGAGSIVTKDVPPYAIVIGNPAKVIKYRFNEKVIKSLQESKWWLHDVNEAKKILLKLGDKCE